MKKSDEKIFRALAIESLDLCHRYGESDKNEREKAIQEGVKRWKKLCERHKMTASELAGELK